MALRHVLLGLLTQGPLHGYDLKKAYDLRFPSAKPVAFGQVYSALAKLTEAGLTEIARTQTDGGPERTVYAITSSGTDHLQSWLNETEPAGPYPAEELVRKTVISLQLGNDTAAFLQQQRAEHLATMHDLMGSLAETREISAVVALDHAIFHLDADLRWLDTAIERVTFEGRQDR